MPDDRIARQIAFLLEADKLKSVLRRTPLIDNSRQENAAEHSWHLALAAMVLREHAAEPCDVLHVLELLVVHDLVEIDAGDTFAYDTSALTTKAEREKDGAARVFGLLPPEQGARFRELWEEFEGQHTVEARVANALDRLQPLLLNASSGGGSWRAHEVTRAQVLARMAPIQAMLPALWPSVLEIVDRFSASGVLREPA
jgi:putative hydrolases of HD superfamily